MFDNRLLDRLAGHEGSALQQPSARRAPLGAASLRPNGAPPLTASLRLWSAARAIWLRP
jgi:hypothetical protein